jgi:hypothetical protein
MLRSRGPKSGPESLEAYAALLLKCLASFGEQLFEGVFGECWIVGACECVKLCELQPAPWRTQHCEPRHAVSRMQQSTSKRKEIENLRAFVEGLDIDGAEGNRASTMVALELDYDVGEVNSIAYENSDLPVRLLPVGMRAGTPFLYDFADLSGFDLALPAL